MSIADPRDITPTVLGTALRDAAVDPEVDDFLPPTNAGVEGELGNPHGPSVVSPEVHGSQGVRPIRPGAVSDDPDVQEAEETEHLIAHQPTAAPGWEAATAYELGDRAQVDGGVLEVTTAGTSGASAPAAPAEVGDTVVDNTVTWTRVA